MAFNRQSLFNNSSSMSSWAHHLPKLNDDETPINFSDVLRQSTIISSADRRTIFLFKRTEVGHVSFVVRVGIDKKEIIKQQYDPQLTNPLECVGTRFIKFHYFQVDWSWCTKVNEHRRFSGRIEICDLQFSSPSSRYRCQS